EAETPGLRQLIQQYEETECSIVGVQQVSSEETDRYGIIDPSSKEDRRHKVHHFVEKPKLGTAPSNLAIMGRYVVTPAIFTYLEKHKTGAERENQLRQATQKVNEKQDGYAYDVEGTRYDVGEKCGVVKTTLEFALKDKEIGEEVASLSTDLAAKQQIKNR